MAPEDCPLDANLAKPANEESSLQYVYYAVTMKPNMACEQNSRTILDFVFDQQFGEEVTQDKKYEMDSKAVLHLHFTMKCKSKLRSYYPYFRKGWMIHITKIKDKIALCKWKHYLTKGDPDDQVLLMAKARTTYLFQD